MSQQFDNTNKGTLFKNDKQGNANWADYQGTINVNGQEFWLSAWIKEAKKDGSKFMSLSVKPKEQRQQAPRSQPPSRPRNNWREGKPDGVPPKDAPQDDWDQDPPF